MAPASLLMGVKAKALQQRTVHHSRILARIAVQSSLRGDYSFDTVSRRNIMALTFVCVALLGRKSVANKFWFVTPPFGILLPRLQYSATPEFSTLLSHSNPHESCTKVPCLDSFTLCSVSLCRVSNHQLSQPTRNVLACKIQRTINTPRRAGYSRSLALERCLGLEW